MSNNTNERLKKATDVIKIIQEHINGIVDIYDKRKLSLQSDLNYFDDAHKSLTSLKASLEMYNEQNRKLPALDIANPQQQLGSFINNLAPNYKETQDAIANAISNLKRQRIDLIKHSQKFQSDSSDSISQIKNAIKAYFDNVTKAKQSKITCARETLELGKTMHGHYLVLLRSIDIHRNDLYSYINNSDAFLKKGLKEEDETVKDAVQIFFNSFQLKEIPAENKSETKQVSYFKNLIDADFFDLFAATGVLSNNQLQNYDIKKITFQARVWEDFDSDEDQDQVISVKKKEIVAVEEVTMNTHWLVKNSQGQIGMVPAAILEPLKTIK